MSRPDEEVTDQSQDPQEWADRFNTPSELDRAAQSCQLWMLTAEQRADLDERERTYRHWHKRLQLLRVKALLLDHPLKEFFS